MSDLEISGPGSEAGSIGRRPQRAAGEARTARHPSGFGNRPEEHLPLRGLAGGGSVHRGSTDRSGPCSRPAAVRGPWKILREHCRARSPDSDRANEIVVIGAHYDTHKNSPGADDNGSAVAALLELARHFGARQTSRTLRFVAFANEEAPFTRRKDMGSRVYARDCRQRGQNITGMICLESIGYYSEESGSQWLSLWGLLLPRQGDFLRWWPTDPRGLCWHGSARRCRRHPCLTAPWCCPRISWRVELSPLVLLARASRR